MSLVPLPWHVRFTPALVAALTGAESFALVGPPGSGKTVWLRDAVDRRNAEAPDTAVMRLVGRLQSPGQLLSHALDWLGATAGAKLQRRGPTALLPALAQRIATTGTTVLVLDEAQHATPDALSHLLLVRDTCQTDYEHAVAFVFIGTDPLIKVLHETGQRGQRVPVVVSVPLLTREEVLIAMPSVAPQVHACLKRLAAATRDTLECDLLDAVGGSLRRLEAIEKRAVFLTKGSTLTVMHVKAAIAMQSP